MSRYAELHDGEVLEFPDETVDAVMDDTVRRHLAGKYPARAAGVVTSGAPMPGEGVDVQVGDVAEAVDALAGAVASLQGGQAAVVGALEKIGAQVAEAVRPVPQQPVSLDEVVQAIGTLRTEIGSLGDKMIEAARVPKKLTFDAQGDPNGVVAA